MEILALIQARMRSSRLPGKVLADILGQPMLARVVDRVRASKLISKVMVVTSQEAQDKPVAALCAERGIACFRGSENDVLDRYFQAAQQVEADVVVRLTADCPLLDPAIIDQVVKKFQDGLFDYVSNTLEPSFPDGLDAEVFSREALERAWRESTLKSEREHVTAYIWKNPKLFRLGKVEHSRNLSALRWTVDEPEDLEFVRRVYQALDSAGQFGMNAVLDLLADHPTLSKMNERFERNEAYQRSIRDDVISSTQDLPEIGTGQILYRKAKTRIPGGTQLLSKRPEMHLPDQWPSYYSRVSGVEVWDLDRRKYIDMSYNGIGACILGAADPEVDAAVCNAVKAGAMSTLNAPEEVELAELLCELHPWAGMVRYTRSGGEAMAIAVRIARACTGRDRIAFCGYHGWHDWYLAANLAEDHALDGHLLPGLQPAGVPRGLQGTALPFRYNHVEELEAIVAQHTGEVAAIVIEPIRDQQPSADFLPRVRAIASRIGAVLIIDEITAGWRLNTGGAHLLLHLEPDIAVFAKGMSNGYAMAAIVGRTEVMQAAQSSFISSTYWTERIGPAAALATIRKHRRENVAQHLIEVGNRVQAGWRAAAELAGVEVDIGGMAPLSHFYFNDELKQERRTLFTQLMLERGFLAGSSFYATYAHQPCHVDAYLDATHEAFKIIVGTSNRQTLKSVLKGPVAHTGFARLT